MGSESLPSWGNDLMLSEAQVPRGPFFKAPLWTPSTPDAMSLLVNVFVLPGLQAL